MYHETHIKEGALRYAIAEGTRWINPEPQVRSITLSTESTAVQVHEHKATSTPWQSWGSTTRYLIVQLAHAIPTGLLIWLMYIRH